MTQNAAMYQVGPAAYYSIDVECVATGTDHNSRAVGQIALVDQYEQVGVQAADAAATAAACLGYACTHYAWHQADLNEWFLLSKRCLMHVKLYLMQLAQYCAAWLAGLPTSVHCIQLVA